MMLQDTYLKEAAMSNPFIISFGRETDNYIDRLREMDDVISDFSSPSPSSFVYAVTGSRGSGKTVFLAKVARYFSSQDDWIVVDPGSRVNILENIASEIYDKGKMKHLFKEAEFSFSFHGLSFSLKGKEPVTSINVVLQKMLDYLGKKGKRVLVTIDEVQPNEEMKNFVYAFQYFQRLGYMIALLMAGLYENVSELMEDKGMTFLYRAPKITLGPLSLTAIANRYMELLGVNEETSRLLAKETKGFAYAYQLLGFLLYREDERTLSPKILSLYDQYLAQYVYDEMYREMSEKEKSILMAMSEAEESEIISLKESLGMSSGYLNVYRTRLIRKGILYSSRRGYLAFALPRFREYIICQKEFSLI